MWELEFPRSEQRSLFAAYLSLEGIWWEEIEGKDLSLLIDAPWDRLLPLIESFYPKESSLYEVF